MSASPAAVIGGHASRPRRPYAQHALDAASADLDAFSRLVLLLHEGALVPSRWQEFLEAVARHLEGNAATLVLRSPAAGEAVLLYSWGCRPEGTQAYASRYFALDPFVQLPAGEVVTLHEFVPPEQLERSEFYRNFLQPFDAVYNLGVDIREADRLYVRFRVCRSAKTGDFSAADRRFCERLVPHLQAAVRMHAELDLVRAERSVYAGAMDDLTMAAIILDESGKVLHTNALAQQLLAQRDGLSLPDRTLALWHPEDAQRFRAAFARAVDAGRSGKPGLVEVIRVQRPSGRGHLGMIIRPAPARRDEAEGALTCSIAVFLSAACPARDAPTAAVQKLFGLTQKEALLALCLADGKTLQEAAIELHITLNTARAHLRAIFAKTGIDRQSKLVGAILRSGAALG